MVIALKSPKPRNANFHLRQKSGGNESSCCLNDKVEEERKIIERMGKGFEELEGGLGAEQQRVR